MEPLNADDRKGGDAEEDEEAESMVVAWCSRWRRCWKVL
jgi:hypothetical protein